MALSRIKDAIIYPINPPPIPELGISSGFDFELEDQAGLGHDQLMAARNQLFAMAAHQSRHRAAALSGIGRHAAAQGGYRPGQGQRAGRFAGGLEHGAHHLFWFGLHQQFRQWQPRATGHRPIGFAVSHAAPERQQGFRAQQQRPDGFAVQPRHLALDLRLAVVATLQRRSGARTRRLRAARQEHGPGHDRHGKAGRTIAQRLWLRMDRPILRGTPVSQTSAHALCAVAHRRVPVRWPRSTKTGPSRSR
jgi:hypothetical protein